MPVSAETPIQFLKGVGKARAEMLAEQGIETAGDLVWFFPFRYEDRRHPTRIADIGRHIDQPVLIRGRVMSARAHISPVKRMKLFEVALEDASGGVRLVFFNQNYLAKQIQRGDRLAVWGAPRTTVSGHIQIESPAWEKFDGGEGEEGQIVGIYSKAGNIPPAQIRRMIAIALDEALPALPDVLPPDVQARLGVAPLAESINAIHRPAELTEDFLRLRSPWHLRIILQEFFAFQLALRVRRAAEEVRRKNRRLVIDDDLREQVRRVLPFRLTAAQKRVMKEIADDLQSVKPMYRLLQGDVGSGKTIVALIAAMIAIRNGHQVALLAPTEILVEQHHQRIRQLLDGSVVMAQATGAMTAGERRTLLAGLREGVIQLVIGTHALLEDKVTFKSLGLTIVDEQHRFGVEQRQKLFAKGDSPDILVMTATPIPRSLALAMYGDLDLSVIDELPPGRQPIRTEVRDSSAADRVFTFIESEIASGAQAYVIYPIIEESEKLNLTPLTTGFESIRKRFEHRRVAMMHGRMSSAEKEETMQRFKRGEVDILVSTTVVEVGIDVPNASVMLIMDADRFGLSQLHQLRGRVGRGTRRSWCILNHDEEEGAAGIDRLRVFAETRDGFQVAERDLELRGPGEFLGTRQSGIPRFRFGNILRDHDLMERARDAAIDFLEKKGLPLAEETASKLLRTEVAAARD